MITLATFILPLSLISFVSCSEEFRRVLLKDVQSLTFVRNYHAVGRRWTIPELQCVGGTAANDGYTPNSIKCVKLDNSTKPQWDCSAKLLDGFVLGEVTVVCEGYDYPGDAYITDGSCGLQYHLDYYKMNGVLEFFIIALMVLLIAICLKVGEREMKRRKAEGLDDSVEGGTSKHNRNSSNTFDSYCSSYTSNEYTSSSSGGTLFR